jgi:hypothetical protein
MNEDIIKWARQIGFANDSLFAPVIMAKLAEFAALVRADEREACAKVCENDKRQAMDWMGTARPGGHFADTIRARSEA